MTQHVPKSHQIYRIYIEHSVFVEGTTYLSWYIHLFVQKKPMRHLQWTVPKIITIMEDKICIILPEKDGKFEFARNTEKI